MPDQPKPKPDTPPNTTKPHDGPKATEADTHPKQGQAGEGAGPHDD